MKVFSIKSLLIIVILSFCINVTFAQSINISEELKMEMIKIISERDGISIDSAKAQVENAIDSLAPEEGVPLDTFDLTELKSTTLLIVIEENKCADCSRIELRKADLIPGEKFWAFYSNKSLYKVFSDVLEDHYNGSYKLIRHNELSKYVDDSNYRYVLRPDVANMIVKTTWGDMGFKGNEFYSASETVAELNWYLKDRKENKENIVNPKKESDNEYWSIFEEIIKELSEFHL